MHTKDVGLKRFGDGLLARVVSIALAGTLAACSQTPPLGTIPSNVKIVGGSELPPPQRRDLFEQNRPYLVGPFDKLQIDVFGVEALSKQEVQVDAGGKLSFPLVGVLQVSGHTPAEIEDMVEQRLAGQYVRNPQVTINLKETVSQVITVDGQVREPGLYPVVGRMSLMRAVATAKGTAEFAKLSDVVVFRTVDGQKMAALYNLKAIRRGNYMDPELYPGDVVVVGDSPERRMFRDFLAIAPFLSTPIVLLLQ